ncbi:hypothetical protein [Bartonella apis]|uniref:hypothetical protein n=1 Tax=Bartonella apis TaxID=1686310 RepID=UPI00243161E2|nr:hypothetical protein [Bartonella apis]
MGFSPAQIDAMSIWEFDAVLDGYIEANTVEDSKKVNLSEEEKEEMYNAIMERNAEEAALSAR